MGIIVLFRSYCTVLLTSFGYSLLYKLGTVLIVVLSVMESRLVKGRFPLLRKLVLLSIVGSILAIMLPLEITRSLASVKALNVA